MVTAGITIPLRRRKSRASKVFTSALSIGAFILLGPVKGISQHARGRNAKAGAGAVAAAPVALFAIPAERAVASDAGGKARRAGQRFAGGDDLEPAAHFVGDRLLLRQIPLPQRRQPVGAQAGLREARDVLGERD